jgi:DNA repair photolyase
LIPILRYFDEQIESKLFSLGENDLLIQDYSEGVKMKKTGHIVYEHTNVEKMLHSVNVWFLPFRWGTNTYRGCEHNCVYCNARYTHEYLGLRTEEFSQKVIVKDNAAEILDKEFSRPKWNKIKTVNLATVTDPYQPVENDFKITRKVLEVFLKHHNSLMLTTKSDLVLRDLDLLSEIGQTGFLNVVITLPTVDESLRLKIEPNAPSVSKRLKTVQELQKAGVRTGITAIPLLPYISDDSTSLENLVKTVADAGADYLIADLLNFRGESRSRFMEFLRIHYPELQGRYKQLYRTEYCEKDYTKIVRKKVNNIIKEACLDNYDLMFSYRKRKR